MELPAEVEHVRTTVTFDEHTVPAGLLAAHDLAAGVWGRLVVESGQLEFVFEDGLDAPRRLAAGDWQVIPPARLHRVELGGPVAFHLEFHR